MASRKSKKLHLAFCFVVNKMASRFVPLQCPVDEFIQNQENKNTLSKTRRDLALLKEYLESKNVKQNPEEIQPSVLDELLSTFLVEVRKTDGSEYEPTTLRSFVSSFDRYLRKKDYPCTIIEGQEFRRTREALVAKQKDLKNSGKGKKTKCST